MMKCGIFFYIAIMLCCCIVVKPATAQEPDVIYATNIKSVKLFMFGNQLAYPILKLNSSDRMELHFDDLDANIKNYSYTWQLCNADWSTALLSQFDFIRGFSQQRIINYRQSSLAFTKYVHYQVILPENNCMPSRSGNFLLKVFMNGDTSKVLFTRRVLVYEEKVSIPLQIQQPFNSQYFNSSQKVFFQVNTKNLPLVSILQQVKVCLLQNNRWDNAIFNIHPTFIRQTQLEYNTETDALFPAGREWRWLDLTSFRLQSDRVKKANYTTSSTDIFVVPDLDRATQRFIFYRDHNGMFYNAVLENINPQWQADYATVHFSFVPPGNLPFVGKDIYLFGELTNYGKIPESKMTYNTVTGMYETNLFLKQGFYDYAYTTVNIMEPKAKNSFDFTEGNFWETENSYMVLVYYMPMGGRAEELVGFGRINSLIGRPGSEF